MSAFTARFSWCTKTISQRKARTSESLLIQCFFLFSLFFTRRVTGTVPLVLHCLSNCTRVVMRYDYGEEDLRKAIGVEMARDRSTERVSESSSEREKNSASTATPLLLFPCPGAEYLEVNWWQTSNMVVIVVISAMMGRMARHSDRVCFLSCSEEHGVLFRYIPVVDVRLV